MPTATPRLTLRPPREPDPLEAFHQEQLFRQCDLLAGRAPELRLLYAVPNGGWRHKATAVAMEKQGVKPGVPDMALDLARHGFHGLKIELKRYREGDVADTQAGWLTRQAKNGYRAVVCWGWLAAWEELLWYIGREDLLLPKGHITTHYLAEYPSAPFWHRGGANVLPRKYS